MSRRRLILIIDTVCTMLIGIIVGFVLGYTICKLTYEDEMEAKGLGYFDEYRMFHFK